MDRAHVYWLEWTHTSDVRPQHPLLFALVSFFLLQTRNRIFSSLSTFFVPTIKFPRWTLSCCSLFTIYVAGAAVSDAKSFCIVRNALLTPSFRTYIDDGVASGYSIPFLFSGAHRHTSNAFHFHGWLVRWTLHSHRLWTWVKRLHCVRISYARIAKSDTKSLSCLLRLHHTTLKLKLKHMANNCFIQRTIFGSSIESFPRKSNSRSKKNVKRQC